MSRRKVETALQQVSQPLQQTDEKGRSHSLLNNESVAVDVSRDSGGNPVDKRRAPAADPGGQQRRLLGF